MGGVARPNRRTDALKSRAPQIEARVSGRDRYAATDLRLPESEIPQLAALIAPPERRAEVEGRLRDESLNTWRVILDARGGLRGAVAVAPLSPMESQLRRVFVRDGEGAETYAAIIADGIAEARSQGARRMMTRVHRRYDRADYAAALIRCGFEHRGERVEFKTPLEELPEEGESRIEWRVTTDVAEAAVVLDAVVAGDPGHSDADGPAEEFIREEHSDPETTAHMEIGSREESDGAFVLAEVAPKTGWSTLSYFGVVPEWRGTGLGLEAHRHGLAVLRSMGGTLYHGGCHAENEPMIAVFRANGCREFARMSDWTLELEVDDD